jgi:hypothetical protein
VARRLGRQGWTVLSDVDSGWDEGVDWSGGRAHTPSRVPPPVGCHREVSSTYSFMCGGAGRRLLQLFNNIDTSMDGLMQYNEFEEAALSWLF